MSESITKQISGVCEEIAERNGWTTFSINIGSQYPVRLSTKLQPLVELGRAAGQQEMVWTYKEQETDRINEKSGKPFVNRYLEKVEPMGGEPLPTSGNEAPPSTSTPAYVTDVEKQRLIIRQSSLNRAVEAYEARLGLNDVDNDMLMGKIMETAGRFERWVYRDTVLEEEPPF